MVGRVYSALVCRILSIPGYVQCYSFDNDDDFGDDRGNEVVHLPILPW